MVRRRVFRSVGCVLFALGLVLGVVFFGSAVWADIEAFLFDASLDADSGVTTLRCPVILTAAEVGEISATFTNPLDRAIQPRLVFHVTDGFISLMREEAVYLKLEPGEARKLSWQVTTQNAAWGYFVLARVYLQRFYPLPSRTSTCGILALDISSLTGAQVVVLIIVSTAILLCLGYALWQASYRPLEGRRLQEARGRVALMVLIGLGTILGVSGLWFPGLVCLIVLVLLVVVLLARSATDVP